MKKLLRLPIKYSTALWIGLGVSTVMAFSEVLTFLTWGDWERYNWWKRGYIHFVNYGFWAIISPLVYYFVTRYRISKEAPLKEKLMALLVSFLLAVFHETITNFIFYIPLHLFADVPLNKETFDHIRQLYPLAVFRRLIEYWFIYVIITALDYQRRLKDQKIELGQLENKLSNAQLSALRFQLQPHFLFNTLNTISALMDINVEWAQKIVSKLGNLLRAVLDSNRGNEISLKDEIEFIQSYLDIEQARFHDRLTISFDVSNEAMSAYVPALVLQPLAENAIKHGFSKKPGTGHILVQAQKKGDRIFLKVMDDGAGFEGNISSVFERGIGLRNLKERLALLYKNEFDLEVHSQPGHGFEVAITLPFKTSERYEQNKDIDSRR